MVAVKCLLQIQKMITTGKWDLKVNVRCLCAIHVK